MAEPAGSSASDCAPDEQRTVDEAFDSVVEFCAATENEDSALGQIVDAVQERGVGLRYADNAPRAVRFGSNPTEEE